MYEIIPAGKELNRCEFKEVVAYEAIWKWTNSVDRTILGTDK